MDSDSKQQSVVQSNGGVGGVAVVPLAHNGQNNHNKRRNSKVPVRELPPEMPTYQHHIYPQLYTFSLPSSTCYKWECIILDLDRTIIHGKRLSVKRWRKYVENGTIPSLAENQCGKWHRHIHRKGHQMHPFIRGRTMIYYRPFTWHLLAVLDYLKSHFGTKIIICTKAGEHYAASVLAALISNFTSANPELIDDVYNFHDLHDDIEDEGKPKKPFRLICNRHDVDPAKTLIVDDNATSWFASDREITNFWMPPCYGYQIHDIDNELQLLCKYLWDPIQQNHLKKKQISKPKEPAQPIRDINDNEVQSNHIQHHSQGSDTTDSSISPNSSPKRDLIRGGGDRDQMDNNISPKNQRYLSPKQQHVQHQQHHHMRNNNKNYMPSNVVVSNLKMQKSISSSYSIASGDDVINNERNMVLHNKLNDVTNGNHNKQQQLQNKVQFADLLDGAEDCNKEQNELQNKHKITSISRIARSYNKRKYKQQQNQHHHHHHNQPQNDTSIHEPKSSEQTRTKKKNYFFESKSRGSKKLAKIIGK